MDKQLAKELKAWRARKGFTQGDAADDLKVKKATYQNWELGRTMPYPELLRRAMT